VIHKELLTGEQGDLRRIVKLHGSIADPVGLILTETDLANLEEDRPRLWAELKDVLRRRPLLSIGSSLRDPSVIRLLEACRPELSGWGVLLHVSTAERRRLEHWGLQAIEGDANSVMAALQRAVNARRSS
jgi:SIR2-like domain